MKKDGFIKPTDCWFASYNKVAKFVGLDSPIRLGCLPLRSKLEYFWDNGDKILPVFNSVNALDLAALVAFPVLSLAQICPGDYFIHSGMLYYFAPDDLTIYHVAECLDAETLKGWIECYQIPADEIALAQTDKIAVWLLKQSVDEGDEWKEEANKICAIPVFSNDDMSLLVPEKLKTLRDGDSIIHGDDVYFLEQNKLVKKKIDVKEMFNL